MSDCGSTGSRGGDSTQPPSSSPEEKGDKAWSDFEKSLEVLLKFKRDEDTSTQRQPESSSKGQTSSSGVACPQTSNRATKQFQATVPGSNGSSGASCETPRSAVYVTTRSTLPVPLTPQNKTVTRNPRTPINQSISTPLHSPAPTPVSVSPMLSAPPPIRSMGSTAGSYNTTSSSSSYGRTVYSMANQQRRILFSQDQTTTTTAALPYPYLPTSALILSTPPPQIQIQSPPMPVYLPVRAVSGLKPVIQPSVQAVQHERTESVQSRVLAVQHRSNNQQRNHCTQQPMCFSADNKTSYHGRNCQLCPYHPTSFQGENAYDETSLSEQAMFQCAGCGVKIEHYTEMEEHVEKQHVGKDPVLVKASILVPNNLEYLKVHQCGIRSCSKRYVAQPESVLKKHIRLAHGEFYVHMGRGRNILRICRICVNGTRYSSDLQLSEHLLTEHPTSIYANAEFKDILPDSQLSQSSSSQRYSHWVDTEAQVERFVERCRRERSRERSRSPFQSSSGQWQETVCKKERHHSGPRSPSPHGRRYVATRSPGGHPPPLNIAPRSPTMGNRWCTPTRRLSRRSTPSPTPMSANASTTSRKRKISSRRSRTRTPTRCTARCRTRSDCSSGICSGRSRRSRSRGCSPPSRRSRSPTDYNTWSSSSHDRMAATSAYAHHHDADHGNRRRSRTYSDHDRGHGSSGHVCHDSDDCSERHGRSHHDSRECNQRSSNNKDHGIEDKCVSRDDSCEDLRQLILREKKLRTLQPLSENVLDTNTTVTNNKTGPTAVAAITKKTDEINNNRSKGVENTAPKDVTNTINDSVSNNKKDKKSVEKENRSPSTESPERKGSISSRKSRIEEVAKIKSIAVDKSAATAKKEFDLNANTEKVEENATRVVKAVHENDYKTGTAKRKSSRVDDRKSSNKHDSDTKEKDDNQHELASEDGKGKKKKRKKSSKHRRHSESSDSSVEVSTKKRRKSRRSEKHHSKHKKKKKKKDKKESRKVTPAPVELSAYCYACEAYTHDWNLHKFMYKHIRNDKKARCLFCPQRIWFPQLKSHIKDTHRGASFVCNASESCFIRLMDLAKIVDHINTKHRKELDPLHKLTGQSGFVSPHLLAKHGLMILPADLKKLTCRLCDLYWLGQDKIALEEHFQQEHPLVKKRDLEANIMFECRGCDGLLFGSQVYLTQHFKEIHSLGGFKPGPADLSEDEMFQAISNNFAEKYETDARRLIQHCSSGGSRTSTTTTRDTSPTLIKHRRRSFTPSPKPSIKLRLGLREDVSSDRMRPMMGINSGEENQENDKESEENAAMLEASRAIRSLEQSQGHVPKVKQTDSERMQAIGLSGDLKPKQREPCLFCEKSLLSSRLENHQKTKHYDLMFHCSDPACAETVQPQNRDGPHARGVFQRTRSKSHREMIVPQNKLIVHSLPLLPAIQTQENEVAETDNTKNSTDTEDSPAVEKESASPVQGKTEPPARAYEMSSSPWKSEIITHLRTIHNRVEGDDQLTRMFVKMPINLKMVICKVPDCDSAVYLGRSPGQVKLDMEIHVDTCHPHLDLDACFSLACRGCGYVLDLKKEHEWILHVSKDHSLPGVSKRIRSVSFSSIEYRSYAEVNTNCETKEKDDEITTDETTNELNDEKPAETVEKTNNDQDAIEKDDSRADETECSSYEETEGEKNNENL